LYSTSRAVLVAARGAAVLMFILSPF
ncbi:MAG: hypothetical protein ACI906_000243, partial [Candidatus Latescibacterota bacterium]